LFAQRTPRIPTSARSIGFCAIWVCISSSSSSSGAALKAIVRGESIRTGRRCTVWDGLEVYKFSSNRHSVPFYRCHQCSSNWNNQTVDAMLYVLLPDGILCRRSSSLLFLRLVRWWQSTTRHRVELSMLSPCLRSTFSISSVDAVVISHL